MSDISFSPWEMFIGAGPVVRFVMMALGFGCLLTWTVALAKAIEFALARRHFTAAKHALASVEALDQCPDQTPEVRMRGILPAMLAAARDEQAMSADIEGDGEGIKERVALSLERLEADESRRLMRGTGLLATIGATAPFVGLFGTVWGIMSSFTGIAVTKATSLAVVAPGIAEALLATAIGLVTAIPAVVLYNALSRQTQALRGQVADLSAQVMRLVSRDLGRMNGMGVGGHMMRLGARQVAE